MKVCVVTGCPSPTGSKAYFAFPNRQKCREKHDSWLMFSGRNLIWWEDHKYKSQLAVCEDHFLPEDFQSCDQLSSESANYELRKKLKAGAIPSRHVTKSNGNLQKGQSEKGRQEGDEYQFHDMDNCNTNSNASTLGTSNDTSITVVEYPKTSDQQDYVKDEDAEKSEESFNKDDSDIQIIEVDSPQPDKDNIMQTTLEPDSDKHDNINLTENATIMSGKGTESKKESLTTASSSTSIFKEEEQKSENSLINITTDTTQGSVNASSGSTSTQPSITEAKQQMSNDSNQTNKKISTTNDTETHLNQAAIKLLQRLEFKNPGRKQIEYGLFNPEESEREKKKLRRFQNSKPRAGVCYKETGMLLDGRDICDCLTETCPGCFYPCPQCSSKKCGPTCRCNRKWVYDYIEDEGRTYRVEFPEQINF
ncbi:putative ARL14 effector protein-like [Apostichopus japonicus]|uniref:Putative ARL14 effector protein-like n=1 Tax=Stichopus japonicus TaxID=307972 RepID=A0A2G8JLV0_STIJA|nr:putative ARL14 effector protein-like [Apostichopus japonicus]